VNHTITDGPIDYQCIKNMAGRVIIGHMRGIWIVWYELRLIGEFSGRRASLTGFEAGIAKLLGCQSL
jgi:hypothetical protein